MNPEDIDVALHELETRIDRLRALYEQYFMGIERLEPMVPRKDVDRRLYALRKVQIRNTAKRFKFQTIVQRYNTFQQYWGRILREIEKGTYKRHALKAERAAKEAEQASSRSADVGRERAERARAAEAEATEDLGALLDGGADALAAARGALDAVLTRTTVKPSSPSVVPAPTADSSRSRRPAAPLNDLNLDLDDVPTSSPSAAPPPTGRKRPPLPSRPEGTVNPSPRVEARRQAPDEGRPTAPRPPPARARPPLPGRPGDGARPPHPSPSRPDGVPPPRGARPPPPSRPDGVPPPRGARPPQPSRPDGVPPPRVARPAAPPPRRPAGPRNGNDLSDDRVREIHARLTAARKKLNQTDPVSMEGLAKNLRASLPKLQQKHKGREVDFDVVVKDGKAVVKPKLR